MRQGWKRRKKESTFMEEKLVIYGERMGEFDGDYTYNLVVSFCIFGS
jgi:hypothetical protein